MSFIARLLPMDPWRVALALEGRERELADRTHVPPNTVDPDLLVSQAVARAMAWMRAEWIQSGRCTGPVTSAVERRVAWQRYLHTTAPLDEKAIRFVVARGLQVLPYQWKLLAP